MMLNFKIAKYLGYMIIFLSIGCDRHFGFYLKSWHGEFSYRDNPKFARIASLCSDSVLNVRKERKAFELKYRCSTGGIGVNFSNCASNRSEILISDRSRLSPGIHYYSGCVSCGSYPNTPGFGRSFAYPFGDGRNDAKDVAPVKARSLSIHPLTEGCVLPNVNDDLVEWLTVSIVDSFNFPGLLVRYRNVKYIHVIGKCGSDRNDSTCGKIRIDKELKLFKKLKAIGFNEIYVDSISPNAFANLNALEGVYFSECYFNRFPNELSNAKNMKILFVGYLFDYQIPVHFKGFEHLQELTIDGLKPADPINKKRFYAFTRTVIDRSIGKRD